MSTLFVTRATERKPLSSDFKYETLYAVVVSRLQQKLVLQGERSYSQLSFNVVVVRIGYKKAEMHETPL